MDLEIEVDILEQKFFTDSDIFRTFILHLEPECGWHNIKSRELAVKQSFIHQVTAHAWTLNECVVY